MTDHAIVVGAGLMGRLSALALTDKGWRVTLLDRDDRSGGGSAGTVAAGMLAPYAELDTAEPLVFALGLRSRQLWPQILARLPGEVFYQESGTLLIAHRQDRAELERFTTRLKAKLGDQAVMAAMDGAGIRDLEPELAGRFTRGVFFPDEGQLDPLELFPALERALVEAGVDWRDGIGADALAPGRVEAGGKTLTADLVVDARGLGAKPDIPQLRGVRGEIVILHAPEVRLNRLVRLMHPRYPIYICPRRDGRIVIGATSIESEDLSPISVQSMLELLSAAYSLHSGFAEARVLSTRTQCRPALPDHLPRLWYQTGLVRLNGLHRHGYLQGPALVEEALRVVEQGTEGAQFPELLATEG